MQNITVEGIAKIDGGEFAKLKINGVCRCEGDITAQETDIDGTFKSSGSINSQKLDCDGTADIAGSIRAKIIDINGMLKSKSSVDAEEIYCNGYLSTTGQISADKMFVEGFIQAREIVGDEIRINSRIGSLAAFFIKRKSSADLIEATTVVLTGIKAKTVSGSNIVIGPRCEIDNLDCSGTLVLDDTAVVKNITGDYNK